MNSDQRRFLSSQGQREVYRFAQEHGHRDLYPAYYSYENLWDRVRSPSFILSALALILAVVYQLRLQQGRTRGLADFLWDLLVSATPSRLLHFLDSWINPPLFPRPHESHPRVHDHASKSELLKKILGPTINNRPSKVIGSLVHSLSSMAPKPTILGPRPPGLVNEGNTCFRNSILQSLGTWKPYIEYLQRAYREKPLSKDDEPIHTLHGLLANLNDTPGGRLRVRREVAYLDGYEQQDAQEYYITLIDDIDKKISKLQDHRAPTLSLSNTHGNAISEKQSRARESVDECTRRMIRNPVEGLLVRRLSCLTCGYYDFKLEPSKVLGLSMSGAGEQSLASCLDRLTEPERILGLNCNKCTLIENQKRLLTRGSDESSKLDEKDSPEPEESPEHLLHEINQALEDNMFDDETIARLKKKGLVIHTRRKILQSAIARAPRLLALHLNRSVYDSMSGLMFKNRAEVPVPIELDLGPWVLGSAGKPVEKETGTTEPEGESIGDDAGTPVEAWNTDPHSSVVAGSTGVSRLEGPKYRLSAIVFHQGWGHGSGHYYTLRNYQPASTDSEEEDPSLEKPATWFLANDGNVSPIPSDTLESWIADRAQDVFMVFYECVDPQPHLVIETPCITPSSERAFLREKEFPLLMPYLAAEDDNLLEHSNQEEGAELICDLVPIEKAESEAETNG
ncbi:hypothetical protein V8F20_004686 [Naviculisporaceae sp. PSN 640]